MDWTYNDKPFNPTPEVIEDYQGFVYELEELSTGKKYIGKKFFGLNADYHLSRVKLVRES